MRPALAVPSSDTYSASVAYAQAATQTAPQTGLVTATLASYGVSAPSSSARPAPSNSAADRVLSSGVALIAMFAILAFAQSL